MPYDDLLCGCGVRCGRIPLLRSASGCRCIDLLWPASGWEFLYKKGSAGWEAVISQRSPPTRPKSAKMFKPVSCCQHRIMPSQDPLTWVLFPPPIRWCSAPFWDWPWPALCPPMPLSTTPWAARRMSTPTSWPDMMTFAPMDSTPACRPPTASSSRPAEMSMATSMEALPGSRPRESMLTSSTWPMSTATSPRANGSPLLPQSQRPSPAPSPGWSRIPRHPSTTIKPPLNADRTKDCSPDTFRPSC